MNADLTLDLTPEQIAQLKPLIERLYQASEERQESILAWVQVISRTRVVLRVKYLDVIPARGVWQALRGDDA